MDENERNDNRGSASRSDAERRQHDDPSGDSGGDGSLHGLSKEVILEMGLLFQKLQESIPDHIKNHEQTKAFSNFPENIQIQALQENVSQTLCAMECANVVGANYLMSVLSVLLKINGCDEQLRMLKEIENEIGGFDYRRPELS